MMYNVLIAEDEKIERDYLYHLLKKSNAMIGEIYLASNGAEAVELFRKHNVDIVMMDINMPIKNGLEALKEIRQIEFKESVCFIFTSYDYFSYAQEAIHLHVEDFILKPADHHIILNNIAKAIEILKKNENQFQQTSALIEKINHTKPFLEEECARLLLSGQNEIIVQKHLKVLNIHFLSGLCTVIHVLENENDALNSIKGEIEDLGMSCLMTRMKNDIVAFIISNRKMNENDKKAITGILQKRNRVFGIGSIYENMELMYQSYMHAVIDREKEPILDETKQELGKDELNYLILDLLECFEDGNETVMMEKLKKLALDCIHREKCEDQAGNQYLSDMLDILVEKLQSQYEIMIQKQDIHFDVKKDIQTTEMEIVYKINAMLRSAKLMRYQNLDHLSKRAIEYIGHHFKKQISLNDVAEELEVSPSHLSRVLSNNNEKGFSDIVNDFRIKEAKRLIRKGFILKDVAFQVGFRSQSYFAKTFKKAVGMSPKEYRNLF